MSETPSEFVGTCGDIHVTRASTASPPATASIGRCLGIGWTTSSYGGSDVGDGDAGILDILDPLLNLGRVCRRGFV